TPRATLDTFQFARPVPNVALGENGGRAATPLLRAPTPAVGPRARARRPPRPRRPRPPHAPPRRYPGQLDGPVPALPPWGRSRRPSWPAQRCPGRPPAHPPEQGKVP